MKIWLAWQIRVLQCHLSLRKKFLEGDTIPYRKLNIYLKTADGKKHSVVVSVLATVASRGQSYYLNIFIIPNLTQILYLGTDFVRTFGLRNKVFIYLYDLLLITETFNEHVLLHYAWEKPTLHGLGMNKNVKGNKNWTIVEVDL